ncbi:MAG: DinB family protein [Ktedonobacteraceae bacterium]|nr:DinB family protein [Ktedonobacteraceae bacterium]
MMDILARYLGYEAWTLRYFISRCREVSPSQLYQRFDIGQGTIHATLAHIIGNLEAWTDLMRERPVRDLPPLAETVDDYLQRFDIAMADFTDCARMLVAEGRLDDTYMDVLDTPPVPKTFGGTLLHVLTHTTVHRWEIQHMLQRLGLDDLIEGDALSWEWRVRHP